MKKEKVIVISILLLPLIGCLILFTHLTKVYMPPETTKEFLISVYGKEYIHYILIPERKLELYNGETFSVKISKNSNLGEYDFLRGYGLLRYSVYNNLSEKTVSPLFLRRDYARRISVLLDGTWYYVPLGDTKFNGLELLYYLYPASEVGSYGSWIPLNAGEVNTRLPSGYYRLELDTGDGWIMLEFRLTDTKRSGERKYTLEIIN